MQSAIKSHIALTGLGLLALAPVKEANAQSLAIAGYGFTLNSAATRPATAAEMNSAVRLPKAATLIAFGQSRLGTRLTVTAGQTTYGTIAVTPPQSGRSFSIAFRIMVANLSGVGRDRHSTACLVLTDYPSSVPGLSSVRLLTREFSNEYPGSGAWSPYEWLVTPYGVVAETKTRKATDNYPIFRGGLKILEKYLPGQHSVLRAYLNLTARDAVGLSVARTLNVAGNSPVGSSNARTLTLSMAMLVSPALGDDNGPGAVNASLPNGDLKIVKGDPGWLQQLKAGIASGIKSAIVEGAKELLKYLWSIL